MLLWRFTRGFGWVEHFAGLETWLGGDGLVIWSNMDGQNRIFGCVWRPVWVGLGWRFCWVGDFGWSEIWLGLTFGRVGDLVGCEVCCVGHLVGHYDGLSWRFVWVGLVC